MKKIVFTLLSGVLLFSCSTEVATDKKTDKVDGKEDVKTETTDTVAAEPAKEELDLATLTLDDYVSFGTREKLEAAFPKESLEQGESTYGEGTMTYKHTVITNPKNGHIVKVLWQEEDENKMNFIEAFYNIYDENYSVKGTQNIPTKSGVSLGMGVKDLLAWNENKEIKFSGFAWDFHGNVHPQEGSKLTKSGLSLAMEMSDPTAIPTEFLGDVTLSTNDEKVLSAPIVVGHITIFIDKE